MHSFENWASRPAEIKGKRYPIGLNVKAAKHEQYPVGGERPLVSIITPSYNQGEFIEDTILSVKNQDYRNIEHIIVDGGSTDNTLDIIKKHEGTYNMRWISEQDEGQADAIGKGFKMAKGAVLTWLNSDDYYIHDKVISRVAYYLGLYENIHVVTGNGYRVDEKGKFITTINVKADLINLKYMRYRDPMLQPSTYFKKNVLEKVSIEKKYTYVFDWLFFLSIFEEGFNVLTVNDFLSAYRRHSKHKTGQDNARRKKEIAEVAKRNFGVYSPQTMHCYMIYWLYSISEFLPGTMESRFKTFVKEFNFIISRLTFYRMHSC